MRKNALPHLISGDFRHPILIYTSHSSITKKYSELGVLTSYRDHIGSDESPSSLSSPDGSGCKLQGQTVLCGVVAYNSNDDSMVTIAYGRGTKFLDVAELDEGDLYNRVRDCHAEVCRKYSHPVC